MSQFEFGHNLGFVTFWVLSHFELLRFITFWVLSQLDFFLVLSQFEFLVLSQFDFLSFVTNGVVEFHQNLSSQVSSHF